MTTSLDMITKLEINWCMAIVRIVYCIVLYIVLVFQLISASYVIYADANVNYYSQTVPKVSMLICSCAFTLVDGGEWVQNRRRSLCTWARRCDCPSASLPTSGARPHWREPPPTSSSRGSLTRTFGFLVLFENQSTIS